VPFASSVMYAGVTTRETLKAEDDGGSFTRTELGAGGRPEEFFAADEWDEKDVFRILPRTEGPAAPETSQTKVTISIRALNS
jgi:hypothetical protein